MAQLSEILSIEESRKDNSQWNVIHLFKEGSFYHAYEWSAFLIHTVTYTDAVREQTSDRKPLSVTRKKNKEGEGSIALVGFPLPSLDKFIPNVAQAAFTPITDSQIDITIELPEGMKDLNAEMLLQKMEEWKEQFPLKEGKKDNKRNNDADIPYARPMRLSDIMGRILAFPLERKTPMEAVNFISDLKRDLSYIF